MNRPRRWVWIAVLLHGMLALLWHAQQPIAWHPQLDAKENLHLAENLARGDFGDEPFYRAMLYPLLLAGLRWLVGPDFLPVAASLLGLCAHWVAAGCVASLAGRLWRSASAGTLALALYGLNPVLLHFALEPLDMTVALALCLGGLVVLGGGFFGSRGNAGGSLDDTDRVLWRPGASALDGPRESGSRSNAGAQTIRFPWLGAAPRGVPGAGLVFAGGLLVGLAVLARPHFLPVLLLLPVVLATAPLGGRLPWRRAALVWVAGGFCLLGFGSANHAVGGEFRLMPWQGPFNLHAANRENANGKYFTQTVFHAHLPDGMNPARAEAEVLLARETGEAPPFDIDRQNAFWRERFWETVRDDPSRFAALQARKVYYLFHDFEQYNNKTYRFHKQRSPVLRWNPLGWGVLLVLAVGLLLVVRPLPVALRGWLLLAAAYAAAMVLYYVSARFRLPLVSFLVVTAAGWGAVGHAASLTRAKGFAGKFWAIAAGRRWALGAAVMALCALAVFPPFFNARDTRTFIQDEMLLANAAAEAGFDAEAVDFAGRALARDPTRQDGLRIYLVSAFNLAVSGAPEAGEGEFWTALLPRAERLEPLDPAAFLVRGVVFWNNGQRERALGQWRESVRRFGSEAESSRKCLALAGALPRAEAWPLLQDEEARALRALLR